MRPYLEAATEPGVVAIGVAQEFQNVFCGWKRKTTTPGAVSFAFAKADRRVSVYYFSVLDRDFGPGLIKLCSYFPYPAKVWVNGHEWAKRQATTAGVAFTELANGFAACDDPAALQAICDRLGKPTFSASSTAGWRIPTPLGLADQAAGYWWELSMRQIEVSRTLVLDQPRRARAFFEALVADNLDLGRPDEVKVIFGRRIRKYHPGQLRHQGRDPRCGGRRQRLLPALPHQAILRKAGRCGSRPWSTRQPTSGPASAAQPG